MLVDLVRRFPSVSVFDIDQILSQVREVIDRASLAVQYVFLFTLAAGITVLLAAIQATRDERRYESAMLGPSARAGASCSRASPRDSRRSGCSQGARGHRRDARRLAAREGSLRALLFDRSLGLGDRARGGRHRRRSRDFRGAERDQSPADQYPAGTLITQSLQRSEIRGRRDPPLAPSLSPRAAASRPRIPRHPYGPRCLPPPRPPGWPGRSSWGRPAGYWPYRRTFPPRRSRRSGSRAGRS